MAKLTSEYEFNDLDFNMTALVTQSTTEPPDSNLRAYGLLFIFAVICGFILMCAACMALLVISGFMKSFFCIRCRSRVEEFMEMDP
ncbi:uncharacterized protein Dere_GG26366 [Drosophila erecta]|uniref:Uncharacterized protein n=1 Tax=Drosophila erecta TaxID=7220 RepID=A0A0Q5VVI4_DROER|nr:uncharacterized protein Dere_GG26366 [Drosophila erecta]